MAGDVHDVEVHEGDWLYVSTPLRHLDESADDLVDGISRVVGEVGRVPLFSPEASGSARVRHANLTDEALVLAQTLIIDLNADSDSVGADLGCALAAGRPVIGLEHDAAPAGGVLTGAITARGGRVITYRDAEECLVQLEATLKDETWWEIVADAAPGIA